MVRSSPGSYLTNPRGHQIDQREDEHPHQVDEVPVEAADFHVLRFELAARHPLRDDREINQPDDHVGHVQPRQRKKSAAEQRNAPRVLNGRRASTLISLSHSDMCSTTKAPPPTMVATIQRTVPLRSPCFMEWTAITMVKLL